MEGAKSISRSHVDSFVRIVGGCWRPKLCPIKSSNGLKLVAPAQPQCGFFLNTFCGILRENGELHRPNLPKVHISRQLSVKPLAILIIKTQTMSISSLKDLQLPESSTYFGVSNKDSPFQLSCIVISKLSSCSVGLTNLAQRIRRQRKGPNNRSFVSFCLKEKLLLIAGKTLKNCLVVKIGGLHVHIGNIVLDPFR